MTTAIVDYGRGNLHSIAMALQHLGTAWTITAEPAAIVAADRVILPGVGAFADCMAGLRERGLIEPVLHVTRTAPRPFLGICVGMQIMAEFGEEFGRHAGLGLVQGTVRRLNDPNAPAGQLRVPNVGWRALAIRRDRPPFRDVPEGILTYFVHSYGLDDADPTDVTANFDFNGRAVPAIVQRDHLIGFQFHAEKSGPDGLGLLRRFLEFSA